MSFFDENIIICPLSLDIMNDPVIDKEGNSYEKSYIDEWLKTHTTSPITKNYLDTTMLTPNRTLKNIIDEYKKNKTKILIDNINKTSENYINDLLKSHENEIKILKNDLIQKDDQIKNMHKTLSGGIKKNIKIRSRKKSSVKKYVKKGTMPKRFIKNKK